MYTQGFQLEFYFIAATVKKTSEFAVHVEICTRKNSESNNSTE